MERKTFTVVQHSNGPEGGFVVRTVWEDGTMSFPYAQAERHGSFETADEAQRHADQMNEMGVCVDCGKPLSQYDLDSTDPNRCDSCETQAQYDRDATEQSADVLPDVPEHVIREATEEFFGAVARAYPIAEHGDFPPDADHAFHLAATRAIKVWVAFNVTPEEEPVKTEHDFVNHEYLASLSDAELSRVIADGGPAAVVDAARALLVDRGAGDLSQPSVYLVMTSSGVPVSACAFEEGTGEILETVEFHPDGMPRWDGAGIADARGGGGDAGYRALHRALLEAEHNAEMILGEAPRQVPSARKVQDEPLEAPRAGASADAERQILVVRFDVTGMTEEQIGALDGEVVVQGEASDEFTADVPGTGHPNAAWLDSTTISVPATGGTGRLPVEMSSDEIDDIAGHLEILADLDEGSGNVDGDALRETARRIRGDQPQRDNYDLGVDVGDRVVLRHPVDRYPHFIAPAGAIGTVVDAQADAISVKMDDFIPGAEEWSNDVVWSPSNGDSILRDVVVVSQRGRLIDEIESRIVEIVHAHEEGRSGEPTFADYVAIGRVVLEMHYPGFPGTTPEGEQFNADALEEISQSTGFANVREVAEQIYERLTAV